MREILFRGKRVDNGQFLQGYYLGEHPYLKSSFIVLEGIEYEVIPESVGQFTGLLDNNGNKIFEGDVVYLVGYGNSTVQFPFLDEYQAYFENDIGSIKGNIYDNPELL